MLRILRSNLVVFSLGYFFLKWVFCRPPLPTIYMEQKQVRKNYDSDEEWGQFIDIDIYNR